MGVRVGGGEWIVWLWCEVWYIDVFLICMLIFVRDAIMISW